MEASSTKTKKLKTEDDPPTASEFAVTNPLDNSVILSHLFKLCPAKMLANCRLVSKQWYRESLHTWRSDFPITFCPLEEDDQEWTIRNRQVVSGLEQFLAYCEDPGNECKAIPYSFIRIEHCDLDWNSMNFQQFRNGVGGSLKRLCLESCVFKNRDEFRRTVYTAFPNLESLQLKYCSFILASDEKDTTNEYQESYYGKHKRLKTLKIRFLRSRSSLPISWLELFAHFQSLTYFSVGLPCLQNCKENFEQLLNAVHHVRMDAPEALKFKTFGIDPVLHCSTENGMEMIQKLRLPLKALRICGQRNMDEEDVIRVLQSHAKSLRKLEATGTPLTGLPFPFGITLEKMTTLEIREGFVKDMSFLKYMPNLIKLRILLTGETSKDGTVKTKLISSSCKQEMAHVQLIHLAELNLENYRQPVTLTDRDVECLFEWMPNLRSMKTKLTDHQFVIVCKNWKHLTELVARGEELTDAGVTGLCETTLQMPNQLDARRPNITNLQNLEIFRFESRGITDASVFNGFLQLPHLRRVEYWNYYGSAGHQELRWGKEAMDAMKKNNIVFEAELD